ncbi:hypothetical protein [Paraburkholderia tropica]|uniref:hypothetical protein n=1 Tax=Paraburkholderia tropica TaxID=92647 RepID=UPI00160C3527|nr:hypothetical protein [Paraburkholderia tropica]MBB2984666.1 hypothetical protein [Paraburkholderia tropica]
MSEQEITAAISAIKAIIDRTKRLVEVRADKRIQENKEVVTEATPKQKDWHRAIKQLREQMEKRVARLDHLKKRYDWEQSHPGKQYQHKGEVVYGSWESFCDAGQLLMTSHRKLAARLSMDTYQRGLLILNIICHGAELEGYTVQMAKDNERLELSKGGAHVEIRITEKLTQGTRYRTNSWDKSREPVRTLTPTGTLTLFVEQQGLGQTELSDTKDRPLEQQWKRILAAIEHRHQGSLTKVAEWDEQKRKWREAEIRREEAAKSIAEENRRQATLFSEVENWQRAELIRAYLASVDSKLESPARLDTEYITWRTWAAEVADKLDPALHRTGKASKT